MEEKNKDIVIDGQQETLLFQDVCSIIEHGRQQAYGSVSHIAIATYWNVGKRIVEEEQNGEKRAAYGIGLMKNLSESLVPVYGSNYSKRNLDYYRKFYLLFPDIQIDIAESGYFAVCAYFKPLSGNIVIPSDTYRSELLGECFYHCRDWCL